MERMLVGTPLQPEQENAPGRNVANTGRRLPRVSVPMAPEEAVRRLDEASLRGRIAGFQHGVGGLLFTTACHSAPFDSVLEARVASRDRSCTLAFSSRFKRLMPIAFVALLLLSIWPGVIITRSLLASTFPNTPVVWNSPGFWWVYFILTVPTAPWAMWSAWRRSSKEVGPSSMEMIQKIASELGGTIDPNG